MAVTVNPLKSAPVATSSGHANDVLQTSSIEFNSDGFYQFPEPISNMGSGAGGSAGNLASNSMDVLLLAFNNSTADWFGSNISCADNITSINNTFVGPTQEEPLYDFIVMGITSVFLGLMILITIIGNVFVIAAILLQRNLQNVANYLIVSLAVADLMVACLVMPFGAIYEISKGWSLGPEYCDMWTSSDVLCCTASILHLVAIAVDRYWAVTNVDYIHTRNGNRIGGMIVVVWSVALIVSLAPQFGWKDDQYLDRINKERRCLPSQDIGYQIFATCSTFYVPLLVILILYWKIFQTARKRIHRRREQRVPDSLSSKTNNNSNDARISKNFLTKRKFLRMKKCKSKKKSTAAEALVSSLVMVEGHSTTTVDVVQEFDEKASTCNHPNNEETTTAFTISKSAGTTETAVPTETVPTDSKVGAASNNVSPEKSSATTTNNGSASHQSHISDISRVEILTKDQQLSITTPQSTAAHVTPSPGLLHPHDHNKDKNSNSNIATLTRDNRRDKKESLEAKRERKAAKTLAIITGAFVVCWLPFFVMALVMPLCSSCVINDYVASIFLWLGYFNSTLNPVIYTIFSPEFRQAFTRILCGARSGGPGGARGTRNFRSGKIR